MQAWRCRSATATVDGMPALTLPLLGFCVGVLFAWAASEELSQRQGALNTQSVWVVGLYALLVHTPACAAVLAHNPDWSVSYLVAPAQYHAALMPALVLLNVTTPLAGFLAAAPAAGRSSALNVLRLGGAALALVAINTLPAVGRLVVVASYNEYHNNFGRESVAGSSLGYLLLFLTVLMALAVAWSYGLLRRLGRRVTPLPQRLSWTR